MEAAHATELKALYIPLTLLRESKHNPRSHFDQQKLKELTTSILTSGILTPLTVRPAGDGHFEIGAGHRRFRAARLGGLGTVPCFVREMSDAEFIELLNIENLQRADIHPLEEAAGYSTMMKEAGYKIADLAARVGKSVSYVYDRVRLLNLTEKMKTAFYDGTITAGHATLLARLDKPRQAEAFNNLFQHEDVPTLDLKEPPRKAKSVRELQAWIDKHVRFDVAAEDVAQLFPKTADVLANATTIAMGKKQVERVVLITHEHFVHPDARGKERIISPRSWRRADGERKSKTCERSVIGVVAAGVGRGEAFRVCLDKQNCRVHYAAEIKEREQRDKPSKEAKQEATRRAAQQAEAEAHKKALAERDAARARWDAAQEAILTALATAIKTTPVKAKGPLATLLMGAVRTDHAKLATAYVKRGTSIDDLVRFIAFAQLVMEVEQWNAYQEVPAIAKTFGVDTAAIIDKVAQQRATKEA